MTAKTLEDFEALRFPPEAKAILLHLARHGGGEKSIIELGAALGMTRAMVARAGTFLKRSGLNTCQAFDRIGLDPDSDWCGIFKKPPGRKSATDEDAHALKILVIELRARIEDQAVEIERLRGVQALVADTEARAAVARAEVETLKQRLRRYEPEG